MNAKQTAVKTPATKASSAKVTPKATATAKRTAKVTVKPQAKTPKATPRKSTLSHAERSAIAKLAAFKAHLHKTFQAERTTSEQKEQRAKFTAAQRAFDKTPLARKLAA